jgi:probable rRNA maturation factor
MPADPDSRSQTRRRRPTRRSESRLRVELAGPFVRAATGLARWLERAAPRSAAGVVAVALVSDARMRALNRRFRGKDRVTDVLSFPASPDLRPSDFAPTKRRRGSPKPRRRRLASASWLGDIVIATGRAARQARDAGHGLAAELRLLALHGLLHLAGYDHETDDGRMGRVEGRLWRQHGLTHGLIERAHGRAARRRRAG